MPRSRGSGDSTRTRRDEAGPSRRWVEWHQISTPDLGSSQLASELQRGVPSPDADPSEHSAPVVPQAPYAAQFPFPPQMGYVPPHADIPPYVRSEESVTGPMYRYTQPPIPYHAYETVVRERDFLLGQNQMMRAQQDREAELLADRGRLRTLLGEARLRLSQARALADSRLHGMDSSSEGLSIIALLDLVSYLTQQLDAIEMLVTI